ncbi:putative ribonuclease H-like domain-containing protein [Tanacetum coccineum]|uniref:Ribonuclease H-like domain-containing protein n=1 Tax=Tanacetum coccineum TaxID=301880 RepID=A0ABQ5HH38_9ASTR
MGQMLYQFQGNQRDYFSNDTFRGRSLVSSTVYYEVTPPNILPLRHAFLGVLQRDAWNSSNKDGRRSSKQEDSKALVTIDGEGVDWTGHSEEEEDYALMACNSSGSDTEVNSCSNECKESYAKLKKLYDAQREQLSDANIEIKAYTQGLKKVEAQLVAHQQGQLWYEEKIRFMKIDLDDKTDVLTYHKKLLAEAQKEKEDLKAKVEKWHNSSKNLSKLLKFVTTEGMHVVPPPMTRNYMPSGPDVEIDNSKFTYGPKQTRPSESESLQNVNLRSGLMLLSLRSMNQIVKMSFDIDVLTKSMNYVPVVAGTNSNDFVGTEESIGVGHSSKETGSSQDYILMPLWKDGSLFDSSSKNASNDEPQPSSDAGKKNDEGVCKESGIDDQEKPKNSTQDINTAGPSINTEPNMFSLGDNATLEATHADFFGDETEVDMSNITTTYLVPFTLIFDKYKNHKESFIDYVMGDGKLIKTFILCLLACFLSQVEPKKVTQALTDPSWIKAMQDELLQFKLQKGYTQEERIDYDEVFALVARIEAIRLFLAYASFMNFVVYQMDVNSAFLYGKIEEEVYAVNLQGLKIQSFMTEFIRPKDSPFDLEAYSDSDYAGASLDRKSMSPKLNRSLQPDKGDSQLV